MLVASSTVLGIFASFSSQQSQLELNTPWYALTSPLFLLLQLSGELTQYRYFTYSIVVGALGVLFILIMLWLINQKSLLPGIVILGSFILFVLWMVALIRISIELWGPQGNVNGNCNLYVSNNEQSGQSLETLAWLQQDNICK